MQIPERSPSRYGLTLDAAPALEPLTLDKAKKHLRVEFDDDDEYIGDLIEAAREGCEDVLDQALITQTWLLTLDCFPPWPFEQAAAGYRNEAAAIWAQWQQAGLIVLPRPPVQSIASVRYVDPLGVTQTLSPSLYQLEAKSRPARLAPAFGQAWPATRPQLGAVQIRFVAGYGDAASSVPARIRLAMRIAIGQWYQDRVDPADLPEGVKSMLLSKWHGTY
jgi:Phage gp6-like head-tail connector protein